MIRWSLLAAVLGALATGVTAARLRSGRSPYVYWLLGLFSLLPAWLIAFVALLGPSPRDRPEPALAASFILSSAAALLGVILSDTAIGRPSGLAGSTSSMRDWLLGLSALVPAWVLALLGLAWGRP